MTVERWAIVVLAALLVIGLVSGQFSAYERGRDTGWREAWEQVINHGGCTPEWRWRKE